MRTDRLDLVGGWFEHPCPECGHVGQVECVSGYELRRLVRDRFGDTGVRMNRGARRQIRDAWLSWYCWKCGHGGVIVRSEVPAEPDPGQGPTKWDARGPAPPGSRPTMAPRGASFFKRPEG